MERGIIKVVELDISGVHSTIARQLFLFTALKASYSEFFMQRIIHSPIHRR